jgi:glutamate---cysteine ligase / carboxylate-amine ligase
MEKYDRFDFTPSARPLTLGVEMELQVLDAQTLRLTPRTPEILELIDDPHLAKEMFRSTIELVTGICDSASQAHRDLDGTFNKVLEVSRPLGLRFAGTGTNPLGDYNDRLVSHSERYLKLLDRNQWLVRRAAVYGLHVHLGMVSGDACIRFLNAFLHHVPELIALSASSPFWRGVDTGLCASRPTVYEAHPTAGMPLIMRDWEAFTSIANAMVRTGSINNAKDIKWDMRPSPGYGTLEIRICDGPATRLELGAITAYIHATAARMRDEGRIEEGRPPELPERWILRENKWRSLRYGLDAEVIAQGSMELRPLRKQITDQLDRLAPFFKQRGEEHYLACLREICARGNSSDRQHKEFKRTGQVEDVVRFNVREFETGEPIWA